MRFPTRALLLVPVFALAIVVAGLPSVAFGGTTNSNFWAKLTGYNEVPLAINTNGFATLKTRLNADSIDFRFEFSGLTSNLVQAHYHFGKEHVVGNVVVFLCGPAGSPARQLCPAATSGVVSGNLTAADVLAVPSQNINANDLAAVLAAIRNDTAYANLHSVNFPGGEIRGQLED
jgi:hypothetical protein